MVKRLIDFKISFKIIYVIIQDRGVYEGLGKFRI